MLDLPRAAVHAACRYLGWACLACAAACFAVVALTLPVAAYQPRSKEVACA